MGIFPNFRSEKKNIFESTNQKHIEFTLGSNLDLKGKVFHHSIGKLVFQNLPLDPKKPWKMKVLNPQYMCYNH